MFGRRKIPCYSLQVVGSKALQPILLDMAAKKEHMGKKKKKSSVTNVCGAREVKIR